MVKILARRWAVPTATTPGTPYGTSYDLFLYGIPPHDTLLPVCFDGHAGRDGDAEAELEGGVGLLACSDAVEPVLDMELVEMVLALVDRLALEGRQVAPVDALGAVLD